MRTRKAIINSLADFIYEIVAIISGFILPRLILSTFGSGYNGITASISQFISCIALLKSGIGGVTRASLYKPLAENNVEEISSIAVATEKFMRRIAMYFSVFLLVFATVYPFLVSDEFEWFFSFTLVLIIGVSTIVQYYFGMTYQMLLQADQRQYVYSITQIITTALNTVLAVILIKMDANIHIVKLGSSLVFMLNPLILNIYVKCHYRINKNAVPNWNALNQRWDAFALQFANFINNNTDLAILTIFTNIKIVSVYTIYYLALNGIRKIIPKIATGVEAALGNIIANKEKNKLEESFSVLEFVIIAMSTIAFACVIVLIVPFVRIYTKNISDTDYIAFGFAYVASVAEFFFCIRTPYQYIVQAAGKFKETRNGSLLEAALNISISVILVNLFGITGVAIGTLVAMTLRTFQYAIFSYNNILHWSISRFLKIIIITLLNFALILLPCCFFDLGFVTDYIQWFIVATAVFTYSSVVTFGISMFFYRKQIHCIADILVRAVKKKGTSK